MKSHFLLPILLLFPFFFSNAQEESIYFPQEQLIIKECENSENNSECLYNYLEQKTRSFLLSKKVKKQISLLKKDTLKISVNFPVNQKNKINNDSYWSSLGNKKLNKKFILKYDKLIKGLAIDSIKNKKPDPTFSTHTFKFNYLIKKNKEFELQLIKNKKPYLGGEIIEVPHFPGCENLSEKNTRECFQKKMEDHIKMHFKYPIKAQEKKIKGRVVIIFDISKEGNIENIRTRGPHPILEEEARRIIKLLPKMEPGLSNGKPTKIPFSIPITFKLQ